MSMLLAGSMMANTGPLVITSLADLFSGDDGFAYEFDDLSTLWQDTGATTSVTTNGDPIGRVDDISGNGYNATQSTASSKPTFNDSSGIRWANYDGGDRLTISSSTASLAWLHKDVGIGIAVLARFGAAGNPNAAYAVMGNNAGSASNIGLSFQYDDRSSASRNDALVCVMTRGVGGSFVYTVSTNNVMTGNTDHSVIINCPNLGPLDGRIDNTSVVNASRLNSPSSSNATFSMDIGTLGNNVLPMTGRIYQIVVRDKEFSSGELSAIQTYFMSKL